MEISLIVENAKGQNVEFAEDQTFNVYGNPYTCRKSTKGVLTGELRISQDRITGRLFLGLAVKISKGVLDNHILVVRPEHLVYSKSKLR